MLREHMAGRMLHHHSFFRPKILALNFAQFGHLQKWQISVSQKLSFQPPVAKCRIIRFWAHFSFKTTPTFLGRRWHTSTRLSIFWNLDFSISDEHSVHSAYLVLELTQNWSMFLKVLISLYAVFNLSTSRSNFQTNCPLKISIPRQAPKAFGAAKMAQLLQ